MTVSAWCFGLVLAITTDPSGIQLLADSHRLYFAEATAFSCPLGCSSTGFDIVSSGTGGSSINTLAVADDARVLRNNFFRLFYSDTQHIYAIQLRLEQVLFWNGFEP